jgi:hypothetical protein
MNFVPSTWQCTKQSAAATAKSVRGSQSPRKDKKMAVFQVRPTDEELITEVRDRYSKLADGYIIANVKHATNVDLILALANRLEKVTKG